jgi:hypothetical protein
MNWVNIRHWLAQIGVILSRWNKVRAARRLTSIIQTPLIVSNKSDAPTELLEFTAIATAVVFFAGWEYSRAYYRVFGIAPGLLDFQAPAYFVWASRPFTEFSVWIAFAVLLVIALSYWRRTALKLQPLASVASVAVLIGLFPLVSFFGRDVGFRDGVRSSIAPHESFALVTVRLKDPNAADRDALRDGAGVIHGEQYYLLGLHRGMYYFLSIDPTLGKSPFVLPVDALSSLIYRR